LISSLFILASFTLPVKALAGDYAPHPDNMGAELLPAEDDTCPAPMPESAPDSGSLTIILNHIYGNNSMYTDLSGVYAAHPVRPAVTRLRPGQTTGKELSTGITIAFQKLGVTVFKNLNVIYQCVRLAQMPLLNWKPEYFVNVAELDNHHHELFDLLNTVYENVMNSLEGDCVLPIIDKLSEYTRYHFSAEEQYMREKVFQGIDEHVAKHKEFSHTSRH
jgi:hypothetical protein